MNAVLSLIFRLTASRPSFFILNHGSTEKMSSRHGDTEVTEKIVAIHGGKYLQTLPFSSSVLSVPLW